MNNRNRVSARRRPEARCSAASPKRRRESARRPATPDAGPCSPWRCQRTVVPISVRRRSNKRSAWVSCNGHRHADVSKPNPASGLLIPEARKQASQHQSHHQEPKDCHRKPVVVRCGAKFRRLGIPTADPATPCVLPEKPRTSFELLNLLIWIYSKAPQIQRGVLKIITWSSLCDRAPGQVNEKTGTSW